ncbi:MAG: hypothetical protein ACREOI_32020 [bacterium]
MDTGGMQNVYSLRHVENVAQPSSHADKMSNPANFLERQNACGKTIQKQWQKNEGQTYGDWVSSKDAHNEATISRKYFLSSIFLS